MSAPPIPPVTATERPRWSVMIPVHNSEEFLAATIDSVLAAGLPPGSQLEVVDDRSTDGTGQVARAYADRGVAYHCNNVQLGASANFNECIRRSRGELVHLLHADDLVRPGFYPVLDAAFDAGDTVAAVTRCDYVDDRGKLLETTRSEGAKGIWRNAVQVLAVSNRIRPPAIVVRRGAYEAVGGFREDLHHAADWEAWVRLALHGPVWFQDEALAAYRVHSQQDTAAQVRSAANMAERVTALQLIVSQLPQEMRRRSLRLGLLYSSVFAGRTALQLMRRRDWTAAGAQAKAALRCGAAGLIGSVQIATPDLPSSTHR